MKLACVLVVRDEEDHIAEWLAWQFMIGFDAVLMLDHGSTDNTVGVAKAMAERYDVRIIAWPPADQDVQITGYGAAAAALAGQFDWVAFFDADEFLVLTDGLTLKGLLAARPEAAVVVPWAIFGSNGHEQVPDALITEVFCRRSTNEFPPNKHVKSIIRPALVVRAINPHVFEMSGETVDIWGNQPAFSGPGLLSTAPVYRGVKLHHYFTRSQAHWRRRLKRGGLNMVRSEAEFFDYDRNEVFDDEAARATPRLKSMIAGLTPIGRGPASPRLGIAISTRNRREMVVALVKQLRTLTTSAHELVVCDDGSTDGTVETLRLMVVTVIAGPNLGIAWNKNRGLYYLMNMVRSDVIILLDDDVQLGAVGWEAVWIDAVQRHGHINFASPHIPIMSGACTAAEPGLARLVGGMALGFSRQALTEIGYFDVRFGRYGHEHTDLSFRAIRAGYGGIAVQNDGRTEMLFFLIDSAMVHISPTSSSTSDEIEHNSSLLMQLMGDVIFRPAWQNDVQMKILLTEIATCLPNLRPPTMHLNSYKTLEDYHKASRANEPSVPAARPAPLQDQKDNAPPVAAAPPPVPVRRICIVACARWESAYIVEWLTYYRALGFAHIYLYCNDDDPGVFYERVLPFLTGPAPFVTFHYHAPQGEQTQMYLHFLEHYLEETDWIAFFDIDEFLRLPPGETINEFMARFPETDSVLFNWIFFGPNGHETPPDGLVLENYTRRAIAVHPYTKHVTRSPCLVGVQAWDDKGEPTSFWHWPLGYVQQPIKVVNVLGEDCGYYARAFDKWSAAFVNEAPRRQAIQETAIIHHYALRSKGSYRARVARGVGGNFDGQTVWTDVADGPGFEAHVAQVGAVQDESLAGFWAAIRAQASMHAIPGTERPPSNRPLSYKKPATASSAALDHGLAGKPDPTGAVNGVINGVRKFHTAHEPNPWWQVDLGAFATITEIHVYNTTDHTAARCRDIRLSVSIDGASWAEICEKRDGLTLGDHLTGPFIWSGPGTAWGRFVRVTLLAEDFLHLDQVEVYGAF